MNNFAESYSRLNIAQKKAVDTIEGPVMVVAGPGTGKTQLLSVRVANILRLTDTMPNNILCLTFTESGAAAMRERLVGLMGQEAYKVAIHTFHSFGTELINHHPEFFYDGANFQPADELSGLQLLESIFLELPHSNPLTSRLNEAFTHLYDARQAISYLKKAGLAPDELLGIIKSNQAFIAFAEPILAKAFDLPRLSAKQLGQFEDVVEQLESFTCPDEQSFTKSLKDICLGELKHALGQASEQKSTKQLTAWRNRWLERNHQRQYAFKDRTRNHKLEALADVYKKYGKALEEHELFDFDDMIMLVLHALETKPEFRFNLQEQYLYIMVDEFQDTNGAQTRLLKNLLDNPVHEGRPNIMVVGDDDQAIYAFQGAEISNMLQFAEAYREPTIVTLTDNYRSTDEILKAARQVITKADFRLETSIKGINKVLTTHNNHQPGARELHGFVDPNNQYNWTIEKIQTLIGGGISANEITILGRNHRQLLEILPYIHQAGLAVNYERRNNVLEAPHVVALITLAQVVDSLARQRFDISESLMPKLLGYDFWGLNPKEIWQLSLEAYQQRRLWLEIMLQKEGKLKNIAEFLVVASHHALTEPLEDMLDLLMGSNENQVADSDNLETINATENGPYEYFNSPFRDFYFNAQKFQTNPDEYLTMLSNLKAIRQTLREYKPDEPLFLSDFVDFIELRKKNNLPITDVATHSEAENAIQLMTAHKSKGLEFETVFILSSQEKIWGKSARSRGSNISFPHNLPITPASQTEDDCLRLFFVAMTRAKHNLYLCSFDQDETGKASLPAAFLQDFEPIKHEAQTIVPAKPPKLSQTTPPITSDTKTLLQPTLANYKLSATHLNNFIDVTNGGPQAFLLQNLLRFPQAMSLSAIFGTAIHKVLQRTHAHLTIAGERRPVEDILQDYELQLQNARLNERDFNHLLEKGSDVLQAYLAENYQSFLPDQKAEYSFASQGVTLNGARLTGAIDLLEIDKANKIIRVIDYKTGKPSSDWKGNDDFERIKLHKYRQQLMMYKLLVENSRDFGNKFTVNNGSLKFVEAPYRNAKQHKTTEAHHMLSLEFDNQDLEHFKNLIKVVWQKIMDLDLPDVSKYSVDYKGVLAFEEDLLNS